MNDSMVIDSALLVVFVFGVIAAVAVSNVLFHSQKNPDKSYCFFSSGELKEMNLSLGKFYSFETSDRGCRIVKVLSEKEATKTK